jgi:hypothetical protein
LVAAFASRRVTARCADVGLAKASVSNVTTAPATRAMRDSRMARVGKVAVAG